MFNQELAEKLIAHYQDVEELPDWCDDVCLSGVLRKWNGQEISDELDFGGDESIIAANLGVSDDVARDLYLLRCRIFDFDALDSDEDRKATIVQVLESLITNEGKSFDLII